MNLSCKPTHILLACLMIAFCACTNTKNTLPPEYVQRIDSIMQVEYDYGVLNGSVLIAKNDTIVYENTFGHIDADKTQEIKPSNIFNIGSIAKEFNGVALMMLQEKGLLDIEDSVSRFDLDLPDWAKKIKIKHLLNYASGLPNMPNFGGDIPTDDIAFNKIRAIDSLLFEPGTNFNYNNYSVFLQRRIVEKVTHQTFEAFVTQNIVEPLNLTAAVFDPTETHGKRTFCYDINNKPCPKFAFISGWLWMNATDLYTYVQAMNNNELISQESFDMLLRNPYAPKRASSLGEYFEKEQVQRHDGTAYGFRSIMLNDFKNDVVVILLLNNTGPRIQLGHMVHNMVLGKEFSIIKNSVFYKLKNAFVEGVNEGIAAYTKLKKEEKEKYGFDNPGELNRLGYEVLRSGNVAGGIQTFQFAVTEFPENANLYDSSGEAYLTAKDYENALKNYKKAIALGGTNGNAKAMVLKIQKMTKQ